MTRIVSRYLTHIFLTIYYVIPLHRKWFLFSGQWTNDKKLKNFDSRKLFLLPLYIYGTVVMIWKSDQERNVRSYVPGNLLVKYISSYSSGVEERITASLLSCCPRSDCLNCRSYIWRPTFLWYKLSPQRLYLRWRSGQ